MPSSGVLINVSRCRCFGLLANIILTRLNLVIIFNMRGVIKSGIKNILKLTLLISVTAVYFNKTCIIRIIYPYCVALLGPGLLRVSVGYAMIYTTLAKLQVEIFITF